MDSAQLEAAPLSAPTAPRGELPVGDADAIGPERSPGAATVEAEAAEAVAFLALHLEPAELRAARGSNVHDERVVAVVDRIAELVVVEVEAAAQHLLATLGVSA